MEILRNLWYMFRRFKVASILNFIGLTIAFAAFYVFMTQVDYNNSYNKGFMDYDRVYRLEQDAYFNKDKEYDISFCRPHLDKIAELPQVEAISCRLWFTYNWEIQKDGTSISFPYTTCGNEGLSAFSPKCIDGKLGWTKEDRRGILIPASIAKTYFGEVHVAGRYMADSVLVIGVYEDFPENSSAKNIIYFNWNHSDIDNYNDFNYHGYVKLRENAVVSEVEKQISDIGYNIFTNLDEKRNKEKLAARKTKLRPISKTYYSGIDDDYDRGNKGVVLILELVCLLVLLVAAINFLNFTLAESPMRIKGINTRLVLGKRLWTQRMELVCESIVVSLFAFVVATGIVYLISQMPEIKELTQGCLAIKENLGIMLLTLAASIITAMGASIYPAFYATSFTPALVLKGSFGLSPKGKKLRTILVVVQLIVSFFMVCYIGVLFLQSHYIFNSDYGFDKEQIFYAKLDEERAERANEIVQKLETISGVECVATSQFAIGTSDLYTEWGREDDEHKITLGVFNGDWKYLKSLGVKILEGRDFNEDDNDMFIINETARKQWDWVKMGQPILKNFMQHMLVVGVCENVRFASMHQDSGNKPMAFLVAGKQNNWWIYRAVLNIRVAAGTDKVAMRKKLEDCINEMEGHGNVNVSFLDKELEETYKEEFRFISQVVIFSVVCLLITLIGVFCLTMFETEYRRKEIGIRKIMGSSVVEILLLLCRKYATMIVIAFVIAAPAAWYFGNEWLKNFAERTEISWWLFALSLVVVAFITLSTVIIQSWKTANENPINSIKTE